MCREHTAFFDRPPAGPAYLLGAQCVSMEYALRDQLTVSGLTALSRSPLKCIGRFNSSKPKCEDLVYVSEPFAPFREEKVC